MSVPMAMLGPAPAMNGGPAMDPAVQAAIAQQQAELERRYAAALAQRKADIARDYPPMVRALRDRRRPIETRWLANYDCWKAQHRQQGFTGGMFNHFIPAGRRAQERFVRRCQQMLFTGGAPFEVYPAIEADETLGLQAEHIQRYLEWRLWRCQFRSEVSKLLRSLCMTARGITKTFLDTEDVPGQIWPSVRAVDPFAFYAWPETATSIAEVQALVEHTMVPYETYVQQVEVNRGTPWAIDPIDRNEITRPEWPSHIIERLGRSNLSAPTDVAMGASGDSANPLPILAITEQWLRRGASWEQSWLVWNAGASPRCVMVGTKPVSPYRMAVDRQIPGELYTSAMMDDLEALNRLLNDQTNMTLEAQVTAMFPPALVNPQLVTRTDSMVFGPRRKWLVDDVDHAVKFGDVPNTAGVGYQAMQGTLAMMDSFSGSSPLAEGTPTRGMPRAGFAVSSLIGLSMSDIRAMAELVEDHILTPLLGDLHRMTVDPAFRIPPQQVVSIPGAEGVTAWRGSVQQLIAAASFRWVGTLQAQDQMQRAQRMLTLLGQTAKIYPSMVTQGWEMDFGTLFKRLWRDGMGERGADTLVRRTQAYQMFLQFCQQSGIDPTTGQPMRPPGPGQPPEAGAAMARPGAPPAPGTGGAQAPAPATPEQAERQQARGMTESSVGMSMAGTGVG